MKDAIDHVFFMKKALDLASQAFDKGEFPVGCVFVYQDKVLVKGARVGVAKGKTGELEHAEIMALANLELLKKAPDPSDITVYCTMEPCLMCYAALLIHGITKIVYAYEDVMGGGTSCDLSSLTPLYSEKKVEIIPHVERNASLAMFKKFFAKPDNHYWNDSLLSRYTLEQKTD